MSNLLTIAGKGLDGQDVEYNINPEKIQQFYVINQPTSNSDGKVKEFKKIIVVYERIHPTQPRFKTYTFQYSRSIVTQLTTYFGEQIDKKTRSHTFDMYDDTFKKISNYMYHIRR